MDIENHTLTRGELFMNAVVFVAVSMILVVPRGPSLLGIVLAAMGILAFAQKNAQLAWAWQWPPLKHMALGTAFFVMVGIFLGIWYNTKLSYYEAFAPFLLTPLMLSGVLLSRLQPAVLWLGSATGALLAGVYASFQSLVLLTGRATGNMSHPIIFGDLAVVLSCIALFGVLYFDQARRTVWLRAYLLLGASMGVWASLLSGTKGGWFSIVMFLIIFAWHISAGKPFWARFVGILGIMALLINGVLLAPTELVWDRLEGIWHHSQHWFETGEITDWSISVRLEMWSYALQLFAQRPILGWSGDVATAKLAEHLQAFNVPASIPHVFENDLLHYAAVSGLLGVTSVLALYAGIFIGFWKFEKQSTLQTRSAFALMGMLLVVPIFEFSLTCNVLGRSSFRYFFCEFTVILLGLMIMSAKEDASSTWHGFILKLKQP